MSFYEEEQIKAWVQKGDEITMIGDVARISAIDLCSPKYGEHVLDAGCGAGFISRKLARRGAQVVGCDDSLAMLQAAKDYEKKNKLGIKYEKCSIERLPYYNQFDTVLCVGVLMYVEREKCLYFLREAFKALKRNGKIVISLTHPELYQAQCNAPNDWISFKKVSDGCYNQSYKDKFGRESAKLSVWRHSKEFLLSSLGNIGFELNQTRTIYVTQKILEDFKQKGKSGPGYFQILAQKQ